MSLKNYCVDPCNAFSCFFLTPMPRNRTSHWECILSTLMSKGTHQKFKNTLFTQLPNISTQLPKVY